MGCLVMIDLNKCGQAASVVHTRTSFYVFDFDVNDETPTLMKSPFSAIDCGLGTVHLIKARSLLGYSLRTNSLLAKNSDSPI